MPTPTIEYHTEDKSAWGPGKWQDEPDKRQWQDEATGLPCLIVRGPVGALCGYVGVSREHPLHGVEYSAEAPVAPALAMRFFDARGVGDLYADEAAAGRARPDSLLEAHGGLTFSGGCGHGPDPSQGICHIPGDGEPDDVWWFGFDCAHYNDGSPGVDHRYGRSPGIYRDLAYVTTQVTELAAQLAEFARLS